MDRRPLAVLTSRVRLEEKLLFEALRTRGVDFTQVDTRQLAIDLDGPRLPYRGAVSREISHTRASYATKVFEHFGVRTVNSSRVIDLCGDKLLTTLALREAGIRTPRAMVGLTPAAALGRLAEFGYPAVVKPVTGSWGRLAARLHDHESAEAIMEHREAFVGPQHQITFVQEYLDKPGRDIKAYVFGGEPIVAIYKISDEWRTNTKRGGRTAVCPLTDDLTKLLTAASAATGEGVLGIDVIEDGDGVLHVNEINHTPEFHGALDVVSVDLVGRYVDYVLTQLEDEA